MGYAEDMCDIVVSHAGRKVRFFVRIDPDTREQDVLHEREDLEWTDEDADAADSELQELVAKTAYEAQMGAENVTQLVKVADDMVLFTGFIEDEVVVVSFERGILGALPAMVGEFREYMLDHDVEFTALAEPKQSADG
ncbi:hypothetical protein [Halobacterium noricense]|uniref:hypothetical protein n=1 Tax=Halobacterium noricense TaxID=223182 RepID=UPI001E3144A6|nr:hypothetical protein [Halobacterium noricense]UHH26221.1 hypothetical protein LT974_04620 [Halobacterium noricense]